MISRVTKHFFTVALFICTLLLVKQTKAAQTVNIAPSFYDSQVCVSGSMIVPLLITEGFDDTNLFFIEISNATGSFSNPTQIGIGYGNGIGGVTVTCTLPANITPGTGYRIRVRSKYPAYTSVPNPDNIRVSAYPSITVVQPDPVCMGSTISMSASTTAPNPSISWALPNGTTVPAGAAYTKLNSTYADSGTYYVTVTSYKCSSLDSARAIVLPQPVFTGWDTDSSVCEGEPFNIQPKCNVCSFPAHLIKYEWAYPPTGTSFNSFINLFSTTANNQGWYRVKITVGTGSKSCSAVDSFFGTIKRLPNKPTVTNNSPVCVDDILVLTANSTTAGATYAWEGPSGFTNTQKNISRPNITKNEEGEYTVYALMNGCKSAPARTTAVVGIPLQPLKIKGDTTLCPGENLQLSAQTSIATGIEWKKLPNNTIISATRLLGKIGVTGADAGTYSVTQKDMGCESPASLVNVLIPDVKKPAPLNNGPLCVGETAELTSATTANGSYSWTGPNGFYSDQQNPVLTNISEEAKGVYIVTARLENCTETDSTTLILKPTPEVKNVSNNGPVCISNTLELYSESNMQGATYKWIGPDNFTSDEQNPSFAYTKEKEGVYSVRVTVNKCVSNPGSTEVTSKDAGEPGVASSNSPLTEGEPLMLYGNNPKPGVQYYWEGPNGFTSNEQNPVIPVSTFMYSGEYKLMSVYQGCSTETYTTVFVKDILGIRMKLFPNPNTGQFTITGLTQTNEVHYVSIYNTLGALVYRAEVIPAMANLETVIDTRGIASGVYTLLVQSRGEKATARFTVTGN